MSQFIATFTGKKFYFDNITPEQICIEDIAHSLSMLCRFTGHVHQFYSVAQHSLLVDKQINGSPEVHLAALLHDAAEAYVNDLASPIKKWIATKNRGRGVFWGKDPSSYHQLHNRILAAIYKRFGLPVPKASDQAWADVSRCDYAAVIFEAEAFLGLSPESLVEHGFNTTFKKLWVPWEPARFAEEHGDLPRQNVEDEFLIRFHELTQMCRI